MKWFFLFLLVLILVFILLSKRYNNPFKLYFVFGKKGSGKSTLLVKKMLKYQRKGWHIYTDMKEVKIPGVRIIDSKNLEFFRPAYHSAMFLGEVGRTYDNRHFADFADGVRDLFKFERKYKFVCWCDSQSYDIDKKLRDLVDGMYLQSNVGNIIGVSRPIRKDWMLTDPQGDSEARIAEKFRFEMPWNWEFTWLPRFHKYFDSFDAPPRKEIPYTLVSVPDKDVKKKRDRRKSK